MADIMFRFWICCFILKKQTNTVIVFYYVPVYHFTLERKEAQRFGITFPCRIARRKLSSYSEYPVWAN